ncbi:MAG: cupin domain-containing protein [Gemmatimonadales bacterium]|nr:cupin domain-containing protein [Gemmatimonadales bacterium]
MRNVIGYWESTVDTTQYFVSPAEQAVFRDSKAAKIDLRRGGAMFLGLNCFEPGQSQPVHTHAGADKFYLVLSGMASISVAGETRSVGPGTLVWAPADVPHGVVRAHERTVLLVGISPPPTE